MAYSVLSPYLVPAGSKKRVNLGDGFILHNIQRLLAPHECRFVFTTRAPLSERQIECINDTDALILAGANQLDDHFTLYPTCTAADLARIKVPIVPFGIGINGEPDTARKMSDATRAVLAAIFERVRYTSWRCDDSRQYLVDQMPRHAEQCLMTGCPVQYRDEILAQTPFQTSEATVVATITERGDFWEREKTTLDFLAERFARSRRILALHQDFTSSGRRPGAMRRLATSLKPHAPQRLHDYARALGFEVYRPASAEECLAVYAKCDLHLGSRLHAHLHFLSRAKRSFLTPVDGRSAGFARTFGFPLCDYRRLDAHFDYDFERYARRVRETFATMTAFTDYLKRDVLRTPAAMIRAA